MAFRLNIKFSIILAVYPDDKLEAIDETIVGKKTKLSPAKTSDENSTIIIKHGHTDTEYTISADVFDEQAKDIETWPVKNEVHKDDIEYELIDVVDEKFYKGKLAYVDKNSVFLFYRFVRFKCACVGAKYKCQSANKGLNRPHSFFPHFMYADRQIEPANTI